MLRLVAPRSVAPPTAASDRELVAALRAGAAWARRELVLRHGDHVRRVLLRVLGGQDQDRGDILQETFARALEGIDELQSPDALKAWVTRIAVFTAREHLRGRRRRRWFAFWDEVPEPPAVAASEDVREAARCAYAVLDAMPEDERIPFALHQIDGMNLEEISDACDVTYATLRRRLKRARRRFLKLAANYDALERWMQP